MKFKKYVYMFIFTISLGIQGYGQADEVGGYQSANEALQDIQNMGFDEQVTKRKAAIAEKVSERLGIDNQKPRFQRFQPSEFDRARNDVINRLTNDAGFDLNSDDSVDRVDKALSQNQTLSSQFYQHRANKFFNDVLLKNLNKRGVSLQVQDQLKQKLPEFMKTVFSEFESVDYEEMDTEQKNKFIDDVRSRAAGETGLTKVLSEKPVQQAFRDSMSKELDPLNVMLITVVVGLVISATLPPILAYS